MLKLIQKLFRPQDQSTTGEEAVQKPAGSGIVDFGGHRYDFAAHACWHEGIPHPAWNTAEDFVDKIPAEHRAEAWLACERAWLDWLRGELGAGYRLLESDTALLLTTQDDRIASVKLDYLRATQRRIEGLLEEITEPGTLGKEILIALCNEDDYYRYVSGFYPEEGEFAMSSGMHINHGCGHFVTHGLDLDEIEPVIVHEMTHSCLSHLAIPAWLNEGIAVTVERKFAPRPRPLFEDIELRKRHRRFWTTDLIQEFWSGTSYLRTDEGNELSYDLGRILVDGLSDDWPSFKRFVREAHIEDGGASAAARHLHADLGEFVRLLLEQDGQWGPEPSVWSTAPERGAF